jgi:hypothetical protein
MPPLPLFNQDSLAMVDGNPIYCIQQELLDFVSLTLYFGRMNGLRR